VFMRIPLWVHRLILSLCFSFVTWIIINMLLIKISIIKYFVLEFLLLLSAKMYIFTCSKFNIEENK